MMLTYKYRIYPTKEQETQFEKWLVHLCELQNSARENRKHAWEEEERKVSFYDQGKLLTQARKKYDDFREVPQGFQEQALVRVDEAFKHFFRRCKDPTAKKGYPRYRKKIKSFAWRFRTKKNGDTRDTIEETGNRHNHLKVPKLGDVKIRMHRPLRGDVKLISIVKKASGWYAHIVCDIGDTPKVEPTKAIGVDVGTLHYLTTSDGEQVENPRWYRKAEGLLKKHSKNLSRKKKGSQRWQKAKHTLGKYHETIANKRKDYIGKLAYKLFHHYENNVLVAEDLGVSNMVKNKHLSKSISDASWNMFFDWCENIAERDGFHFHKVNPQNTSQNCSCCGIKSPEKLSLAIRTFNCSHCGISIDRDHNAAINILIRAACALRGERWVTDLYETRSVEIAKHWKLKSNRQLVLFDAFDMSSENT